MKLKRLFAACLAASLLTVCAYAEDGDLDIRVETIKERRGTYTSVTDMRDLDILTPESASLEAAYKALAQNQKSALAGGLFAGGETQILPPEERVRERAEQTGLFMKAAADQPYYRAASETQTGGVSPLFAVAAIAALCVGGFIFSNNRYKRKKSRGVDVRNSNPKYV